MNVFSDGKVWSDWMVLEFSREVTPRSITWYLEKALSSKQKKECQDYFICSINNCDDTHYQIYETHLLCLCELCPVNAKNTLLPTFALCTFSINVQEELHLFWFDQTMSPVESKNTKQNGILLWILSIHNFKYLKS